MQSWSLSNIVTILWNGIFFNAGDDIVVAVDCKCDFDLGNPEAKVRGFELCKSNGLLVFVISVFVLDLTWRCLKLEDV